MAQNQDPNPAQGAAFQALEEENRVLRQRLSGESAGLDPRLLRLTEILRQENLRLSGESETLGTKNIELVFQVEELEQQLLQTRAEAEQAGRALEEVTTQLRERDRALEEVTTQVRERDRALEEARDEHKQSQAQSAARLQEVTQAGRAEVERLEAGLASFKARVEVLEAEAVEVGSARDEALESGRRAAEELTRIRREAEERGQRLEELEEQLARTRSQAEEMTSQAARASQDRDRLEAELGAARAQAQALEVTLKQVQEQFLQRIEEEQRRVALPAEMSGPPDQILSRLLGSLLGPSGQHLVARIYARSQVDRASRDPQELERVLQSLEETAARLLSTPEQADQLHQGLASVRARLLEPSPVEPVAPPSPAEPVAPPSVAAPEEEPDVPAPVTASEEGSATSSSAVAPEEQPTPGGILPLGVGQGSEFHGVTDPDLLKAIEEGNKLLSLEKFDQSWDIFQRLAQEHPQALPVLEGLFYNYVDSCCWVEAAGIGRRILYVELEGPGRARFVKAMHATLIERLKAVRDAGERKILLLNLAELHLDDPAQARDFLGRARQIPGRTPADARADYYLAHLQAEEPTEQLRSALGALEGVADRLDLYECLDGATSQTTHRTLRPAAKVVLALVRRGRQQAAAAEEEGGERVAPGDPDPNLVDEEHDEAADLVQEFVLNQLLPRARVTIPFPAPAFSALQELAEPVPAGWKPAEFLDRLNWRLFRKHDVQALLYRGQEPFWLRVTPEPAPQVLFHPDVAGLPASEQQGLALRALFHLHHRHLHVLRASEVLDAPLRCRLVGLTRDVVQDSKTDVSDWLEKEIDGLDPGRPDLDGALEDLLDRLYNQCLREEFQILKDFLVPGRLFSARLEGSADRFVARLVGVTEASYGIARLEVGRGPLFQRLETEGFQALYAAPWQENRNLRLRLQRLWLHCLR